LISQPGSDYQLAEISVDAGNARDIMLMLLDVHAVLDHLYLDGTRPGVTAPAEEYLRESASPYTLPSLIGALGDVVTMLGHAIGDAGPPPSLAADRSPGAAGRARPAENTEQGKAGSTGPEPRPA
jgi:hypothetical protein